MSKQRLLLFGLTGLVPLLALAGISVFLKKETITPYPILPSAAASSHYSVTVNGQPVQVQVYDTATGNISFARFSFSHSADVAVTASEPVSSFVLSPQNRFRAAVSDRTVSFTLAAPQRLVLRKVNALAEELFLLADTPEKNAPVLGSDGVTDALTLEGIDNRNIGNSSPGINQAINRMSDAGGGTLFFQDGIYKVATSVMMKSNVTVYLAPGAVWQVPSNYRCCFTNQGVVNFVDVTNAKLTGRGVINGNAVNIPENHLDFHMIYTENTDNLEIDDVLLLDQGVTGIRLVDARKAVVRNIKIIANHPSTESDGIDFDSSHDVLVDNAFIYSSDDNTGQGSGYGVRGTIKDIYNLNIQNSVFYNARTGAAFKIGTGGLQNYFRNIKYNNIDVISCRAMAALYPSFGANIKDISFSDIRVETVGDRMFELHAVVPTWNPNWNKKVGYVHQVTLTNISSESNGVRNSDFIGFSPMQDVSGIVFNNYRLHKTLISSSVEAHIDLKQFVSNVTFNP